MRSQPARAPCCLHSPARSGLAVPWRPVCRLQVEAQGVADLVHQPQPRFELIKQHYPQVGVARQQEGEQGERLPSTFG